MIPLRDNQPTSSFPIVTILLIVVNVIVFILQQIDPTFNASFAMIPYRLSHMNMDLSDTIARMTPHGLSFMHIPATATHITLRGNDVYFGPVPFDIRYTIFTAMFMHASWLHLGGNMLYLWIFGNNIEDALGKFRFLLFYLACGVAATLAQFVTAPDSVIPSLGASGAIAGVLGAYFILYPRATVLTFVPVVIGLILPIPAWIVLGLWFVLQIGPGFHGLALMSQQSGVAYFAHIGGFVAGWILIKLLGGQTIAARQRQRSYVRRPDNRGYH